MLHSNHVSAWPVLLTLKPNKATTFLFERFAIHGLLEKVRVAIKGIGNLEDFLKQSGHIIENEDLETFVSTVLKVDFANMSCVRKTKCMYDILTNLLQCPPNYENFLRRFVHPLNSAYFNNILSSSPLFSEDKILDNIVIWQSGVILPFYHFI